MLSDLLKSSSILAAADIFLCNIPYFFAGRDDLPS